MPTPAFAPSVPFIRLSATATAATSPRSPAASPAVQPHLRRPRRSRPFPASDALVDFSREIAEHELLTLPEERALLLKIRPLQVHERVRSDLNSSLGQAPTDHQLAAALGLSPSRLLRERRKALRARDALVHANLRLVVRVASRVHKAVDYPTQPSSLKEPAGVSLTDLIQEGSLALIRAAEKFDFSKGERFAPYACRAIWSRCRRAAVPASCIVSLPDRLRVAARKLGRFRAQFERENGERPSDEAEAAITPSEPLRLVRTAEKHLRGGMFLDSPLTKGKEKTDGGRTVTVMDTLTSNRPAPEDVVDRELVRRNIREACYKRLSKRDADILALRFGLDDGKPVLSKVVAERFGISAPRVTQIVLQAMETLRVKEPELAEHLHIL